MTAFYQSEHLTVYKGDVLDELPKLAPGSIDSVVTSPPYAMQRASTYGGVPEKDYPDWTVAWMGALAPALKDDGSVIINISPHVKNGELSDYVLRTRLALREAGWTELGELIWHKTRALPVGNIHRPRRHWESLLWYGKHPRPYSDAKAHGKKADNHSGHGRHKINGWDHYNHGSESENYPSIARCPDVISLPPSSGGIDHPAPFPWQLAEWCAKLICPPGGTVLDPFSGSGSTAVAALRNGFQSVAIEREPEYAQMIVDRFNTEVEKQSDALF